MLLSSLGYGLKLRGICADHFVLLKNNDLAVVFASKFVLMRQIEVELIFESGVHGG